MKIISYIWINYIKSPIRTVLNTVLTTGLSVIQFLKPLIVTNKKKLAERYAILLNRWNHYFTELRKRWGRLLFRVRVFCAQLCSWAYINLFISFFWQDIIFISIIFLNKLPLYMLYLILVLRGLLLGGIIFLHNRLIVDKTQEITFYELFNFITYSRIPCIKNLTLNTWWSNLYLFLIFNWISLCLIFYYFNYLILRFLTFLFQFYKACVNGHIKTVFTGQKLPIFNWATVKRGLIFLITTFFGLYWLFRVYEIYGIKSPYSKFSFWQRTRMVCTYGLFDYIQPLVNNRRVWYIKNKGVVCNGPTGYYTAKFIKLYTLYRKSGTSKVIKKRIMHKSVQITSVETKTSVIMNQTSNNKNTVKIPGLVNSKTGQTQGMAFSTPKEVESNPDLVVCDFTDPSLVDIAKFSQATGYALTAPELTVLPLFGSVSQQEFCRSRFEVCSLGCSNGCLDINQEGGVLNDKISISWIVEHAKNPDL